MRVVEVEEVKEQEEQQQEDTLKQSMAGVGGGKGVGRALCHVPLWQLKKEKKS